MYEKLSKDAKLVADYMQHAMALRDERKNPLSKGFTLFFRIANEIFKRVSIPSQYIPYIAFQELLNGGEYLQKNMDKIVKRKDGRSFYIDYKGDYIIDEVSYNKAHSTLYDAYLDSIGFMPGNNSIEGTSGSPGVVTGKVRVIVTYNDDLVFNEWDILVTGMTRPEFVPLMKKASAVVTNEGSITCHAAILCRELGIPCVIGTKIATTVLSDGDIIKVNADEGKIFILWN